jgi:hypothetical protein
VNFVDMLLYSARTQPAKQAIILADRIVTFGMIGGGRSPSQANFGGV